MKRKNMTRNALVTSILSLLLCVSMLVGTTFAWFTDEVTSGRNTIAAGNLDIELLIGGDENKKVTENTVLFDNEYKWEPGMVVYEDLQIANVGTLALKYQLTLDVINENNLNGHKLSEVVKIAVLNKPVAEIVNPNMTAAEQRAAVLAAAKASVATTTGQGILSNFYLQGPLLAGEKTPVAGVVIFWEPNENEVDNLYNANNGQVTSDGQPLFIEFGVNLQATQLMHENDSFDNTYDEFASLLPHASVINTGRKEIDARAYPGTGQPTERITLDTSYQFLPNEQVVDPDGVPFSDDEYLDSAYRFYHADWVVSVDRPVKAGSAVLAGYYKVFGDFLNSTDWIYLTADLDADTPVRLVQAMGNGAISVNYEEICKYANDGIGFLCGAADLTGENIGTTLTVELRLYETTKAPDATGGTANDEVGPDKYISVGKFYYTFGANSAEGMKLALDAKSPKITLQNDIVLNDAPLTIDYNTEIDLNGHTITGISTSNTTSNLIKVAPGAELTLTGNGLISFGATTPDTNWGGEGQPAFPGYANNTISCQGKLIIDGVTIKNVTAPGGASYAIDCYPGAELVINSGVIDGVGKCAIRMFANSNTTATNVTVNGGQITGKRAIWIQLPGSNIASEKIANLTINGGKLICTNKAADVAIYSYSFGDSFAKTNVTITGGEFDGLVAFGGGEKTTQETVTITGGTFNDGVGRYLANDGWEDITVPTV